MYSEAVSLRNKTRVEQMWRMVAAALLLVFCAAFAAPFATAQAVPLPACCQSMHGCSLRMHHAIAADPSPDHRVAAVRQRCPCPLLAPSISAPHSASAAVYAWRHTLPLSLRAHLPAVQELRHSLPGSGDETRGPPASPDIA